jgi:hypothetical protein
MQIAQITWNTGRTRRVGSQIFEQNKPERVSDPAVIAACKITRGFSVTMLDNEGEPEPKAKAPAKPPVKQAAKKAPVKKAPKKAAPKKAAAKKKAPRIKGR